MSELVPVSVTRHRHVTEKLPDIQEEVLISYSVGFKVLATAVVY
jgi:hypothetical protein